MPPAPVPQKLYYITPVLTGPQSIVAKLAAVLAKPPTRTCTFGNLISGADTHPVCASCPGLQHAQDGLASPASCEHCARLSLKSRRRRLVYQASLLEVDPLLGVSNPPSHQSPLPMRESPLWQEPVGATSLTLLGLTTRKRTAKLSPFCRLRSPPRAAAKLGIEWPETLTETTTSWYEGKRLPKVQSAQGRHWSGPARRIFFTSASHRTFATISPAPVSEINHDSGRTIHFNDNSFHLALNEKIYKAVAASVNALSLLLAYQAELQQQIVGTPIADLWDELCVVTDLCMPLHRSTVQSSGRAMVDSV
ncbi:hypothetical protein GOODEAATRI_023043 [Goodea atripinnis]|uniref:Uncharacterized protein n=1 Tax=Goodea atripinnis TaxID=208336 RepID=A0ABV0N5Y9_9TELE